MTNPEPNPDAKAHPDPIVAKLQAEAAATRTSYQATRYRGAATGNLTRGQQQGGSRR